MSINRKCHQLPVDLGHCPDKYPVKYDLNLHADKSTPCCRRMPNQAYQPPKSPKFKSKKVVPNKSKEFQKKKKSKPLAKGEQELAVVNLFRTFEKEKKKFDDGFMKKNKHLETIHKKALDSIAKQEQTKPVGLVETSSGNSSVKRQVEEKKHLVNQINLWTDFAIQQNDMEIDQKQRLDRHNAQEVQQGQPRSVPYVEQKGQGQSRLVPYVEQKAQGQSRLVPYVEQKAQGQMRMIPYVEQTQFVLDGQPRSGQMRMVPYVEQNGQGQMRLVPYVEQKGQGQIRPMVSIPRNIGNIIQGQPAYPGQTYRGQTRMVPYVAANQQIVPSNLDRKHSNNIKTLNTSDVKALRAKRQPKMWVQGIDGIVEMYNPTTKHRIYFFADPRSSDQVCEKEPNKTLSTWQLLESLVTSQKNNDNKSSAPYIRVLIDDLVPSNETTETYYNKENIMLREFKTIEGRNTRIQKYGHFQGQTLPYLLSKGYAGLHAGDHLPEIVFQYSNSMSISIGLRNLYTYVSEMERFLEEFEHAKDETADPNALNPQENPLLAYADSMLERKRLLSQTRKTPKQFMRDNMDRINEIFAKQYKTTPSKISMQTLIDMGPNQFKQKYTQNQQDAIADLVLQSYSLHEFSIAFGEQRDRDVYNFSRQQKVPIPLLESNFEEFLATLELYAKNVEMNQEVFFDLMIKEETLKQQCRFVLTQLNIASDINTLFWIMDAPNVLIFEPPSNVFHQVYVMKRLGYGVVQTSPPNFDRYFPLKHYAFDVSRRYFFLPKELDMTSYQLIFEENQNNIDNNGDSDVKNDTDDNSLSSFQLKIEFVNPNTKMITKIPLQIVETNESCVPIGVFSDPWF